MIRRIIYEALLFALPFVLYALYLRLEKSRGGEVKDRAHPWTLLFASGLGLVIASFIWLGVKEGAGEQGTYVPAHVEDGKVIPGHVESGKDANP